VIAKKSLAVLNQRIEAAQESSHRRHLGASELGHKCERQLFYSFRWVKQERFSGQMLRLFRRGHNAEVGFHDHLRTLGATVWPTDEASGTQWRVVMAEGHSGGSADGVAMGGLVELPPDLPYLTECKTHNDKSFNKLKDAGLMGAKPEHFSQMQLYMSGLGLTHGLYMAVNKNDDHLHLEIVQADPDRAAELVAKAERVVWAESLPPRAFNSPAWFECKWCHYGNICWRGEAVERNCRTCRHAAPAKDKAWTCALNRPEVGWDDAKGTGQLGCKQWALHPMLKAL